MAGERTLNQAKYRQSVQPFITTNSIAKKARNGYLALMRGIKKNQPHHGLIYQIVSRRWHYPRDANGLPAGREWPSDDELIRREKINSDRQKKGL